MNDGDLISRRALLDKFESMRDNSKTLNRPSRSVGKTIAETTYKAITLCMHFLKEAPAVDVKDLIEYHIDENARTVGYRVVDESHTVPVVHGRWIHTKIEDSDWGGTFNSWKCSVCGYYAGRNPTGTNYCPNCGAKMDGGEDNG